MPKINVCGIYYLFTSFLRAQIKFLVCAKSVYLLLIFLI